MKTFCFKLYHCEHFGLKKFLTGSYGSKDIEEEAMKFGTQIIFVPQFYHVLKVHESR